jgi:hypothetical protein
MGGTRPMKVKKNEEPPRRWNLSSTNRILEEEFRIIRVKRR